MLEVVILCLPEFAAIENCLRSTGYTLLTGHRIAEPQLATVLPVEFQKVLDESSN